MTDLVAHAKLRVRQIREVRKNRVPDEKALRKEVLKLALPATGEQLLSMMVSIVDTMLVGHLGASALAAVSWSRSQVEIRSEIVTSISFLTYSFFIYLFSPSK